MFGRQIWTRCWWAKNVHTHSVLQALLLSRKILKCSLDLISSPSVKIQSICVKFYLEVIRQNIAGWYQQTFFFKSLLATPSNVLPFHLKQTFLSMIWIFTEGEGDGIKPGVFSKIFFTLPFFCHQHHNKRLVRTCFFCQSEVVF